MKGEGHLNSGIHIGVIGLGQMGLAMAGTLERAGLSVMGTDVSVERRALFASSVATPEDLAARCGVIAAQCDSSDD